MKTYIKTNSEKLENCGAYIFDILEKSELNRRKATPAERCKENAEYERSRQE